MVPDIGNAERYGHRQEQQSLWKGYKGEAYYDYWYNPSRRGGSRGITFGAGLQEPMGQYPMKGYIGGFRTYSDGSGESYHYSTGD